MATEPSKIFTLFVKPGIKRDGTRFEADEYNDGKWVRFQRGKAKKIGGYRQMFASPTGIPRGMITNSLNGVNYIYAGNYRGVEVFNTGTDQGVGVGPFPIEFNKTYVVVQVNVSPMTIHVKGNHVAVFPNPTTFWAYNTSGVRTNYTTNTTPTYHSSGDYTQLHLVAITGMPTAVPFEIYVPNGFASSNQHLWQFDIAYDSTGVGNSKLLAHPGHNLDNIDSGVNTSLFAGNFLPDPTTGRYLLTEVIDSTGATPTYLPIDCSGGVVVLHPFVFVYGNFGLLRNNNVVFNSSTANVQTFSDWNGTLANEVNVTAGKIVRGFPIRGGTSSPSGLFWATDSLVRVSFTGQTPYYWRYDTVSNQTSIMSSSSVVEMDGTFFWMGVDRFYLYNGGVKVLPNDKNVNYLFDNINFTARQKVWATKVPRYNEIWFFYPRGTATECTDCIIFNVKDNIWYDAGQADGARRSCGYVTEVFPRPVWAGWDFTGQLGVTYTLTYGPNRATAPTTTAYQVIAPGDLTTNPAGSFMVFNTQIGETFVNANQITAAVFTNNSSGGYTTLTFADIVPVSVVAGSTMSQATGGYVIWEQEFGKNKVTATEEIAIDSFVETCDISWVGGTPASDEAMGVNRRMHLTRIEPDFKQVGDMELTIVGRPFANDGVEEKGPFTYTPTSGKVDLRVEARLVSLRWRSNVIDGDYEAGRTLITAEFGDERP
jgi:hypothetical protein